MTIVLEPQSRLQYLLTQRDRLDAAIATEVRRGQTRGRTAATGSSRHVVTRMEWTHQLIAAAAIHYGIPLDTMTGRCRESHIVTARHTAYWLLRQAGRSLHEIGRAFDVHHTTVLHGAKRIDRDDETLRAARLIYKAMTDGGDE